MTTSIQEQTDRLAREAATYLELVLDDLRIADFNRELLNKALGKVADIMVLNGKQ